MRSTWVSILLLFIKTNLVPAYAPGDVEQRYDNNEGKNVKEDPHSLEPIERIDYGLSNTLVTKSNDALLQLAPNKNFTTFYTIDPNGESVESASGLARYGDNENHTINWMKNDGNKDGEVKPEPPAILTSATTMPSIDTANITDYRLPDDITPSEYILKIRLEDENLFHGIVKIRSLVRKSTKKIVLHVDEMKVHDVKVTLNEETLDVVDTLETFENNFFTINLAEKVIKGSYIHIDIDYTGQLNVSKGGLRRSTYVDDTGETRWFAATELAPIGARKMFPCFDEPHYRTSFTLSVSRPANYKAIANTRLISSTPDRDGNIMDTFERTDPLPTYLLSLVIGDFEYLVNGVNNYTIWATPTVVEQGKYALDNTVSLSEYYEEVFRTAQFPSYCSMVALPNYSSRVEENCGSSVYSESEILRDPENTPITAEQTLIGVVSQELSHRWFGASVSPSSWNHIWLGTGFAMYFRYHGSSAIKPQWRLDAQFVVEQLHAAFESDARKSTRPLTHAVDYSPAEISRTFNDDTSSAKSASVIRMIELTFGVPVFRDAMDSYHFLGRNVPRTPHHLRTSLQSALDRSEEKVGIEMETLMNSWTEQAGYPVVSVKIEGRVAHLVQERFYSNSEEVETGNNQTWWIPITWASESNSSFARTSPQYWLKEKSGEVGLNGANEWVIFNIQQSGYYRVNYDPASWERIVKVLKSDDRIRIHPVNRAALINDLLTLGQAGQLDYATALSATQYLTNETDYIPWRAAFNSLAYLNRQFKDKDIFELYKTHVLTILNPIYEKLGLEESSTEMHTDRLLRVHVVDWACEFDVASCIQWSRDRFAVLKYNATAVPVNLRKTVYCTRIKNGHMYDWNFLWERYSSTRSAAEKVVILDALGCSKHTVDVERLLSSAITKNSGLRFEDSLRAFSAVYSSGSFGTEFALAFVARNLKKMHEYYQDESSIDSILTGISSAVATKRLLLKMEDYVNTEREDLAKIGLSSEKYLKTAYETAAWYGRYSPAIYEWLDETYRRSDYRLPRKIYPLSYDIYLTPYLNERDPHFEGHIMIKMNATADTSIIVLHANGLELKNIVAFVEQAKNLQISKYTIDKMTDRLTIYLKTVVAAGTELSLQILYSGLISDDMYGFYRSSYIDKNGKTRWLASTQFQSIYARRAFPCFDEPAFKATFTIHIERPNDYQTLSNMRRLTSLPSTSPNRTWDSYEQSVPMSTYLVAFVMSDFDSLTNGFGNYTIWAPPETVKLGEYALDVGQKALRFLEQYTGIDNPIGKIDLVAIPDFHSGAMENWGLMTFRDYGLLGNENVTSARLMKYLHTLVAHETVHTWFGNLVTCDWWDHIWLHEGFADYFQWIAGHYVSPSWKLLQQFVVYEMHPAMEYDASSTRSMNSRIVKPSDIAFDFIPYEKSASVIRMLHHALGKRLFKSALRTYLEERKWKTATPDHLLSAIQFHADRETSPGNLGTSIKVMMASWTENFGYPVVNASWDRGLLSFAQERFVYDRNLTLNKQKENIFWIPVTMTTKAESNFRSTRPQFWLNTKTANTSLILNKDEWFIINIQETGYYRVNYDVDSWKRLVAGLMSDNFDGIHEINRAQIIDDLFNLARADYVTYDLALSAATYLVAEDNHLAWAAFFEAVNFLHGSIGGREGDLLFRDYVLMLVEKTYKKIGFVDLPEEKHMDRLNREMILRWTCKLEHPGCIESALKLYNEWRKIGVNRISPNVRPAVYCTAIKYGGFSDWQFFWNEYVKTRLGSEKVVILKALGCSTNVTTLLNYLKLGISSDNAIRDQDVLQTINAVLYGGDYNVFVMIIFLQTEYHELRWYYGDWEGVANLFHRVSSVISTESQLRMFKDTVRRMSEDVNELKTSLLSAVDTAEENLRWTNAHKKNIEDSLRRILGSTNREEKNSSPILSSSLTLVIIVFYLVFAY